MKIVINDESIRLGQLLKKIQLISSGGQAKSFLAHNVVKVNGKISQARNCQVHVGSTLWINDDLYQVVAELG